jgi:hypothetical protein
MGFGLVTAGIVAGAASGAASGILGGKKKISTPKYTKHEKALTGASQILIPEYFSSLMGRDTPYIRRLLAMMRSQGYQQAGGNVQRFLSQVGARTGSDFGPAATKGISNIYAGIAPQIMNAISQAKLQQYGMAQKGLQQWSLIKPGTKSQPKQASAGRQAAAGALGGLGQGLGAAMKGGFSRTPAATSAAPAVTPANEQLGPINTSTALQQTMPAQRQTLNRLTSQATGLNRYLPGGVPGF